MARLTSKLSELRLVSSQRSEIQNSAPNGDNGIERSAEMPSGALTMEKVQPLLSAYDETINELQGKLSARKDEIARFEQKLDEISTENSHLVERLKDALRDVANNVRSHCIRACLT